MFTKEQKIKFVKERAKELKNYSLVGVIHLDGKPDRLLQSSRNKMKPEVQIITGKKSLLFCEHDCTLI